MTNEDHIIKRFITITPMPQLDGPAELINFANKLRKDYNGELVKTDIKSKAGGKTDVIYEMALTGNGGFSLEFKEDLRRPQNVFGEFLDTKKK